MIPASNLKLHPSHPTYVKPNNGDGDASIGKVYALTWEHQNVLLIGSIKPMIFKHINFWL